MSCKRLVNRHSKRGGGNAPATMKAHPLLTQMGDMSAHEADGDLRLAHGPSFTLVHAGGSLSSALQTAANLGSHAVKYLPAAVNFIRNKLPSLGTFVKAAAAPVGRYITKQGLNTVASSLTGVTDRVNPRFTKDVVNSFEKLGNSKQTLGDYGYAANDVGVSLLKHIGAADKAKEFFNKANNAYQAGTSLFNNFTGMMKRAAPTEFHRIDVPKRSRLRDDDSEDEEFYDAQE